jgi:hypothetical protein
MLLGACLSASGDTPPATNTSSGGAGASSSGGGTPNNGNGDGRGTGTGDAGSSGASTGGNTTELIDDMEANTGSILASKGRVGAWYVYNDATPSGTQVPGVPFVPAAITPPRGTSGFAARTTGKGFGTWGAGMGFNFNDPGDGAGGSKKTLYDASAYKGLSFYAKAEAGTAVSIRMNISNKDTDPAGGVCSPPPKCSDDFGKSITLTNDWKEYTITFSDLTQQGYGTPVPTFDASKVYAVHFQVAKGANFDFWIDDIAFLVK